MRRFLYLITPIRLFCTILFVWVAVVAIVGIRSHYPISRDILALVVLVCLILLIIEFFLKRSMKGHFKLLLLETTIIGAVLSLWAIAVK